jgi:hypothetical protein
VFTLDKMVVSPCVEAAMEVSEKGECIGSEHRPCITVKGRFDLDRAHVVSFTAVL